jgi:hypothetical protein
VLNSVLPSPHVEAIGKRVFEFAGLNQRACKTGCRSYAATNFDPARDRSSHAEPKANQVMRALICGLTLLLVTSGCGQRTVVGAVDKTRAKLQAISGAYVAATVKANRPPAKADDLLPFLGDATTTEEQKRESFRSDNDGEEFVIVWNVDLRKIGVDGLSRDVILAYEKLGKKGQRYVLKPPADVFIIPDDVFQKSDFPKGHKPGS